MRKMGTAGDKTLPWTLTHKYTLAECNASDVIVGAKSNPWGAMMDAIWRRELLPGAPQLLRGWVG